METGCVQKETHTLRKTHVRGGLGTGAIRFEVEKAFVRSRVGGCDESVVKVRNGILSTAQIHLSTQDSPISYGGGFGCCFYPGLFS